MVGLNLLLQAAFDVQEGLVLLVLTLHLCSDLSQPLLHTRDLALELRQVFVVATFGFCQRGFQVFFLRMETRQRYLGVLQAEPVRLQVRLWSCGFLKRDGESEIHILLASPTMVSWACTLISKACS